MIRLCRSDDVRLYTFCEEDALGTRIVTAARAYPNAGFAQFWLQENDGKILSAIARVDSDVTVCKKQNTQQDEELQCFLNSLGARTITAPGGTLQHHTDCETGVMMQWNKEDSPLLPKTDRIVEQTDSVKELVQLFSSCAGSGFSFTLSDGAYVDLSHRIRHGLCKAVVIRAQDNTPCAAAMTVAESEKAVLIGGVCTKPTFRRQGLAFLTVLELCNRVSDSNRTVFLLAQEQMVLFYQRIGFSPCGAWEQTGKEFTEHAGTVLL